MLKDLSVTSFCEEVDSDSPAPGGGSVSALCGALGVSLTRMYGHLSISKKRFKELDAKIQQDFIDTFSSLEALKKGLMIAIDKDSDAYNKVMDAIHLPKSTPQEIEKRHVAMQEATIEAIKSPYEVMELCYQALEHLNVMIPYGNKNAVSDIAVGVLLMDTALKGAGYNVRINLSSIDDEEVKETWKHKMDTLLEKSESLKNTLIKQAEQYM